MAKLNYVVLYGIAEDDPIIIPDEEGNPEDVYLPLRVAERTSDAAYGKINVIFSTPIVRTNDRKLARELARAKKGDYITVTGMLTTTLLPKSFMCNECHKEFEETSEFIYVAPKHLRILAKGLPREDTLNLLREDIEESDEVLVCGNLCEDPLYSDKNGEGIPQLEYQLAVTRTKRIANDTEEDKTDYPFVHAYGVLAEEGKDALMCGSKVLIRGHLRTTNIEHKRKCSACGHEFVVSDFPYIEIAPAFVEYLYNCNFPESSQEEIQEN